MDYKKAAQSTIRIKCVFLETFENYDRIKMFFHCGGN